MISQSVYARLGILVMENEFLLHQLRGMPFCGNRRIFDVFISVVIMVFCFRINKLFTHIDVNKLSRLKG